MIRINQNAIFTIMHGVAAVAMSNTCIVERKSATRYGKNHSCDK